MACKARAPVAPALMILAVLVISMSFGNTGVEARCLTCPSPDGNACREGGLKRCRLTCDAQVYKYVECDNLGDCLCIKCVDQGPPAAPHTRSLLGM